MILLVRLTWMIDRLTPEMLKHDMSARSRAQMFLISHLLGPLVGIPIPLSLYMLDVAPNPHVPVLLASIVGFWFFIPMLRRWPQHYQTLALLSITNLSFAILWASFHYGGTGSPFLMWYPLLPVVAFFFLGTRLVTRLLVGLQLGIGLLVFSSPFLLGTHVFHTHLSPDRMMLVGLVCAFSATTYAFFMACFYASAVDSQSELMKEIARHEETLAALTETKERVEASNRALQISKGLADARNAELECTKASLEYNAQHDALTGLPNRRYLHQVLFAKAKQCRESGRAMALLHIDLDRFKQINDTLGHAAGDDMLSHVSRLVSETLEKDEFVARIGGDEFILVCAVDSCEQASLADKANALIEKISRPVPYNGHVCRFGASIGIAVARGNQIDPKALLVNSDIALHRAKQRSKGRCEFFNENVQAEIVRNKKVADDVLRGIEQREFIAFYQPQFTADTHEIAGVEALVRWRHPADGILTPQSFLKTAEDLNVLGTIDRMVFTTALDDFDRWKTMGLRIPKVAVNVSTRRLNDRELIHSLAERSFEPGTVAFELVESIFLDETEEIISSNIEQLKALGIEIEIDDFGTGYASIVSLLKLNPKRLKVDRQFVAPIANSAEKRRLVASIVEMGKSLGIEIVAEGVETMEQARILRDLGCDVLQGYAFARPMSAADFEVFARTRALAKAS